MKPKLDYTILQPTEADIQKSILDYLRTRGYFCWRNNTGMQRSQYDGRERFIRYGLVGSGDLLGLTKEGRFFSIEVKRPGKKPTPEQIEFMATINQMKGLALVAYNVDDVIKAGL